MFIQLKLPPDPGPAARRPGDVYHSFAFEVEGVQHPLSVRTQSLIIGVGGGIVMGWRRSMPDSFPYTVAVVVFCILGTFSTSNQPKSRLGGGSGTCCL